MTKYLSLLLLGSIVSFATVHAGDCKKGCKKDRIERAGPGCKDKHKKDRPTKDRPSEKADK
ncbi:MAG: hypothetical protein LLF94_04555 [Chlamydiales bacterium]|nr:hypothetical protein [Chlamydiales bacterium]